MATSAQTLIRQTEVSERRYRRLFESAHDGILILDAGSGAIIDANPYMMELLGYEPGELLGKQPWEIGIFSDIEANRAALKELQEKGTIRYEDLPLQTKNRQHQIDVEFVSNVYQEGDQTVIQCNIRDIRARKAATDAARLEADRINRLRDEFFATVVHELRGPLQGVALWASALERTQGHPEKLKECLDGIARGVQAESRIIEDLLEVSRINIGKLSCECKPLDVVQAISTAVERAHLSADEKKIRLQLNSTISAAMINADAGRLQQIFGNILSNAVKFTPDGGAIEVSVSPRQGEIEIQFKDSGIGIPASFLPRIFDRFQQVETRSLHRNGGLGLGLTITKELVILHGGKVTAESAGEGLGTTIHVVLPLVSTVKCEG